MTRDQTSSELPIVSLRGQRVLLDADLAVLYGVSTKALNQAVKRNADRFPDDFCFQLNAQEWQDVRTAREALTTQYQTGKALVPNRSQSVTGSQRHRDPRFLPFAFTEHGALQAANVLRSKRACVMSLYVIRAFVKMREALQANAAILKRLAEIDKTLLLHDARLRDLYYKLLPLLAPPPDEPGSRMGFNRDRSSPR
jgi:hypothetical protein